MGPRAEAHSQGHAARPGAAVRSTRGARADTVCRHALSYRHAHARGRSEAACFLRGWAGIGWDIRWMGEQAGGVAYVVSRWAWAWAVRTAEGQ